MTSEEKVYLARVQMAGGNSMQDVVDAHTSFVTKADIQFFVKKVKLNDSDPSKVGKDPFSNNLGGRPAFVDDYIVHKFMNNINSINKRPI
jgi:hypothetical protein